MAIEHVVSTTENQVSKTVTSHINGSKKYVSSDRYRDLWPTDSLYQFEDAATSPISLQLGIFKEEMKRAYVNKEFTDPLIKRIIALYEKDENIFIQGKVKYETFLEDLLDGELTQKRYDAFLQNKIHIVKHDGKKYYCSKTTKISSK